MHLQTKFAHKRGISTTTNGSNPIGSFVQKSNLNLRINPGELLIDQRQTLSNIYETAQKNFKQVNADKKDLKTCEYIQLIKTKPQPRNIIVKPSPEKLIGNELQKKSKIFGEILADFDFCSSGQHRFLESR